MKKLKYLLIVIMSVLTITGCSIGDKEYELTVKDNSDENDIVTPSNKEYTYKELEGIYQAYYKIENSDYGVGYTLYLNEDGTFVYKDSYYTDMYYFGNYMIDGNKLILNYLYKGGHEPVFYPFTYSGVVEINSLFELSDKSPVEYIDIINSNSVILGKLKTIDFDYYRKLYNQCLDYIKINSKIDVSKTNLGESNSQYNYKNLSGIYSVDYDTENGNVSYLLYLSEYGRFVYEVNYKAGMYYFGNYIIDGNKIILSYAIKGGHEPAYDIFMKTSSIEINSLTSLVDKSPVEYTDLINRNSITLTKDETRTSDDYKLFEDQYFTAVNNVDLGL